MILSLQLRKTEYFMLDIYHYLLKNIYTNFLNKQQTTIFSAKNK